MMMTSSAGTFSIDSASASTLGCAGTLPGRHIGRGRRASACITAATIAPYRSVVYFTCTAVGFASVARKAQQLNIIRLARTTTGKRLNVIVFQI